MTDAVKKQSLERLVIGAIGTMIMTAGITAPLYSHEMTTIAVHHLLHAGMAVGAGLLALAIALPGIDHERGIWIWPAIIAPAIGLLLMWPSEYAYLMSHPWLHLLDHLSIALMTFLAVYAAQAYVRGLGWLMLVLVVAMDAACAGGFGVSPGPSFLLCPLPQNSKVAEAAKTSIDQKIKRIISLHARGSKLYNTMGCSGCHSVDGSKGVGPTWKNLAGYPQKLSNGQVVIADYSFLRAMILDPGKQELSGYPAGVMPDTYKIMLTGPKHPHQTDLNAIVWYINTLSNKAGKASEPPVPDRPVK
jgi:cytochrome c2